ncbi:MAG: peptide-methionine (R)-S-oxide reductase MsrB [Mariprofundaceae bacterium]
MNRRQFIKLSALAGISAAVAPFIRSARADHTGSRGMIEKIEKSDEEWRQLLSPEAFDVLRREGTERPFSSALNKVYDEGTYVCAGCDLPLFTSATKFDSGTGWPSFFAPIEGHTETKRDFRMILPRTEYHCARCGGHQGHVFEDGPKPTGQRWCNNGVALRFVPA